MSRKALSKRVAALKAAEPLAEPVDLARYRGDPIAWAVERMGIPENRLRWSLNPGYAGHVWDGDRDPLVRMWQALADWKSVGVEAGTGVQKTHTAALVTFWFLDVFRPTEDDGPGAQVITAAPKEDQLRLHLWKEARKLWPRFQALHPAAELTDLRIRMRPLRDDWGAVGFATGVGADEESATKAQGFHAEHMLIITEETPGIHRAVMAAFENTSTAPHNLRLALGNPDHQLDELHQFCQSPGVVSVRISALDHPNVVTKDANVVPGAVAQASIDRRRAKYGEDSPLYQSRVRGVSPAEATDALIKLAWLKAAVRKTDAEKMAARALAPAAAGVDVANSENGDEAALVLGTGALLESCEAWPCKDANALYREHIAPRIGPKLAANRVGIDGVGIGAGCVNEARRLRHPVVSLLGSASPIYVVGQEEQFLNLRCQMWWTFAMELFHGEIAIVEEDEELFADLLAPKWEPKNGKIVVESKEKLRERLPGKRSPNKGDAAVYWNWVRKQRLVPNQGRMLLSRSYQTI